MTTNATPTQTDGSLVVTADTTIADLEEAMTYLARRARRLPRYMPEHAKCHDRINALLGYWTALHTI